MYVVVHTAAGRLPATQITFARSLIALIAATPGAYRQRQLLISPPAWPVWLRSGANAVSIVCLAWNLQHTTIGFANILFNLAPVVVLVLGLRTGAIRSGITPTVCMILVAVGSCLCWQGAPSASNLYVWAVGLIGAIAAGIHYTMLEQQSAGWSPSSLIWPLSLISLPLMIALKTGPWAPLSGGTLIPLAQVGGLCLVGQYLVIVSLRYAGLAIGTALVPSAVAFGVAAHVATAQGAHDEPILGSFVYLAGLMPLIALKAGGRELVPADEPGIDVQVESSKTRN